MVDAENIYRPLRGMILFPQPMSVLSDTRAVFRALTAVVIVASIALVSLPVRWPYPALPVLHVMAVISIAVADIWAWLVVALVTLLCWRQPNNRSALNLSGFLTLCVLSVLLFTRSFSASFDRPLPQFLAGTVCLLFAVVCWWWFCQGFPQRFFDEPLPENIEMPWILRMHGKMPRTVDYSVTFSSHRIFLLALLAFSGVVWAIDGEVRPNSFYLLPILISWGGNMLRRNYALSGADDRRKILWILEGSFLLILLYGAGQSAGLLFWIIKGANGGALTYR